MIAALPMYDWPEVQSSNDQIWNKFAEPLAAQGMVVPKTLMRSQDLLDIWLAPDLLIAQTCSYPLETLLRGKVQYVATPSYPVEGCEKSGTYRSVILMRGSRAYQPVPNTDGPWLPDWSSDGILAVNDKHSMSGCHAFLRDAENAGRKLPQKIVFTGSHRASIVAVATGTADVAAVDCVSWDLALKHEAAANEVYVAGWTKIRPGLPLITSLNTSKAHLTALRAAAVLSLNAIVLSAPTEF